VEGLERLVGTLRVAKEMKDDLHTYVPSPYDVFFTEHVIDSLTNYIATYCLMFMAQWGLAMWRV
jgi:hypothetical protein